MRGIKAFSAVFILVIILISGCTTTQQTTTTTITTTVTSISELTTISTATTTATTSTATTTATTSTATTTATTSTQPVQPCSRQTIDGPDLISHLPGAQPGWDTVETDWVSEETDEGCNNTRAWIVFIQDDLEVEVIVHIYDSNHVSSFPPEDVEYGTVFQNNEGYGQLQIVDGFDAWETAMYGEGLVVWVDIGNGIWVIVMLLESTDTSLLYPYLYSVDYDELAALA